MPLQILQPADHLAHIVVGVFFHAGHHHGQRVKNHHVDVVGLDGFAEYVPARLRREELKGFFLKDHVTGHAATMVLFPCGDTVGHTVDSLTSDVENVAPLGGNVHPECVVGLSFALVSSHGTQHVKDDRGLTGVGLAYHQRDGVFLQPLADKEAHRRAVFAQFFQRAQAHGVVLDVGGLVDRDLFLLLR